jgi:hypothetical protein
MSDHAAPPPGAGFDLSEPRTRFIAVFGLGTLLALAVIIVGLQAYVDRVRDQEIFKRVLEPVSEDMRALRAREDIELNSYAYIDRAKGTVRLPIARAMELLSQEYAQGKLPYPTRQTPVQSAEAPPASGAAK